MLSFGGLVYLGHYYSKAEKLKRLLRATPIEGDGYRSAAPTRMRFTSSAKYPLIISDDTTTMQPAPSQPGSNID